MLCLLLTVLPYHRVAGLGLRLYAQQCHTLLLGRLLLTWQHDTATLLLLTWEHDTALRTVTAPSSSARVTVLPGASGVPLWSVDSSSGSTVCQAAQASSMMAPYASDNASITVVPDINADAVVYLLWYMVHVSYNCRWQLLPPP